MPHVEEIYIDRTASLTRVAHLCGGRVSDLFYQAQEHEAAVGDIYRGKVNRVIPSMQAAFIDLGLEQNGFLHVRDLVSGADSSLGIDKLLHEGQMLLVQISKQSRLSGTTVKGPTLTTEINLANSFLVYLPTSRKTADVVLSKKIGKLESATSLRESLLKKMNSQDLAGRLIVRSQALNSDDEIAQHLTQLSARWADVESAAQQKTTPGLVASEQSLIEKTCQNIDQRLDKVWFGDHKAQSLALAVFAKVGQQVDQRIQSVNNNGVANIKGLVDQAEQTALSRMLTLPSGGSVVFDATEALTVVDVNSGNADVGPETYQQTNLEAAREITLQLRLRNIGGIVIVDFINTERKSDRSALLKTLGAFLAEDSATTHFEANSSLGLVEITRARKHANIAEHFVRACDQCAGSGQIQTAQAVGREILTQLRNHEPSVEKVTIVAAPAVVDFLQQQQAYGLHDEQTEPKVRLAFEANESSDLADYNIVLG